MRPLVLLAVLLAPGSAGCDDIPLPGGGADGGAPIDAAVDAVDAFMDPGFALLKVCALVTSCDLWPHARNGPACIAQFKQGLQSFEATWVGSRSRYQVYVDCAAGATDCDSMARCVSGGRGDAWCQSHPGDSCDGDVLTACGLRGWATLVTDCRALGQRCTALDRGKASCNNGVACDRRMGGLAAATAIAKFTALRTLCSSGASTARATAPAGSAQMLASRSAYRQALPAIA